MKVSIYIHSAEDMFLSCVQPTRKQPVWWDQECANLKVEKYETLNVYRKSNQERQKEKQKLEMYESIKDPNKMWRCIKGKSCSSNSIIAGKDWQQHFSALLNVNYKSNDAEFEAMVREYVDVHNENCHTCELGGDEMLNGSITGEEIKKSIMSMKNSKAPGKDGIVIECFKMSMEFIIPKLSILFNKILYLGKFPNQCGLALICPLHKKGSPNVPSNYRGISLLNVMGKIFTKVLNNRLVMWGNVHSKFYEEQAGFREKYCTVDQIFVLNSVVQKYLSRPKGRFYCAFVDFSTAFDCIQHNLLFYALVKKGVHGNFIKVIQSMYKSLKSCVKTPQGLTEVFGCSTGTRQGCILSLLFSHFF